MCLDAVNELVYRSSLRTRMVGVSGTEISGVSSGHNVFDTPFFFSNREDFAAAMGISSGIKEVEIKFVQVSYQDFIDTGNGDDDCPVLEVNYEILLYQQFKQIRNDVPGSKPYNDFIAWVMNTQRSFVTNREVAGDAEVMTIAHSERVRYNEVHPAMPGEKGIFTTLRVKLEVK